MERYNDLGREMALLWGNYKGHFFLGSGYLGGIRNTLILAVVATLIGCVIGFACGVLNTIPCAKTDPPAKRFLVKLIRVIIRISLETLKYAQKGGRIPMTAAVVGTLLHVKPILRIQDGVIQIEKKVRGNQAAYDWMARAMDAEWDRSCPPSLASAQCPELLQAFVRTLTATAGMEACDHQELGPVIGVYSGPGAVGVAYLLRENGF